MAADVDSEIARLQDALTRLEAAAEQAGRAADDKRQQVEAERDLVRLKHRRLFQETETALGDLDALIASAGTR